jgi:DNA-binding SARP family transcriptional activator
VEFRLLGSVQIWSGGEQISLKRRQERLLLAVLLLEPGKAVSADRLMELLWPEAMPTNPAAGAAGLHLSSAHRARR